MDLKGVFTTGSDGCHFKNRSNVLATPMNPKRGDDHFRKWEYWDYKRFYMVHYTGKL